VEQPIPTKKGKDNMSNKYNKAVSNLIEIFGLMCFIGHLEDITSKGSFATPVLDSTGSPWSRMYKKDLYARDRVMKSARLLLPFLNPDDKRPDTILDVGCFTFEAKKYFPRAVTYIGLDQKAYHKDTRVVDLDHGFEPIPCDHALCLETLEHLHDPYDTLVSIYKSMKVNGYLVLSLPNEATAFHRIRSLFGIVDADCFSSEGKHLHLPSLQQSRKFVRSIPGLELQKELYYISPSACNSKSPWIGRILSLIPDSIHYYLANNFPSLFARGFIFLLKRIS